MAEAHLAGRSDWSRSVRRGAATDLRQAVDLLNYLTGSVRETEKYLDLLWVQTENAIGNPRTWRAIEALAEALLSQPRIGGRLTRRIIDNALNGPIRARAAAAGARFARSTTTGA